jgi:hypothetical protein
MTQCEQDARAREQPIDQAGIDGVQRHLVYRRPPADIAEVPVHLVEVEATKLAQCVCAEAGESVRIALRHPFDRPPHLIERVLLLQGR